jgi:DNA-binding MarR family transcriptional regulator
MCVCTLLYVCARTQYRMLLDMVISDAERAWAALLRVHALLVPEFDREMHAASGLPLTWYDVLLELQWAGEPLRMTDLGERVVLSRTRVSRIVDELAEAGLVSRETNPEDGRSSFVRMTDDGRAKFRQAAKVYREASIVVLLESWMPRALLRWR